MPRNKSERPSSDPRIVAMHAFAREVKVTRAKSTSHDHDHYHGLDNLWDAMDQYTKEELMCDSNGSYNQMADYIDSTYGAPDMPAPTPLVNERTPLAKELIAFALLCKKNDYRNVGAGDDLSAAYKFLSKEAKWELANINVWKQMANHIFRNHGGEHAA